jgi:O6-methylguanine-DNA--protein-cysteine methyltransferase
MFSSPVHAETAQFTILGENQCAPFEGVLFSKLATAEILSGYDRFQYACDSVVQYELSKLSELHRFEIESLRIEHKALTQEYDLFISQKDKEIQALAKSLKKTSPRNKTWWFIGGIVVGSAATYGAYRAFDER